MVVLVVMVVVVGVVCLGWGSICLCRAARRGVTRGEARMLIYIKFMLFMGVNV